jgi:hypothetical protein
MWFIFAHTRLSSTDLHIGCREESHPSVYSRGRYHTMCYLTFLQYTSLHCTPSRSETCVQEEQEVNEVIGKHMGRIFKRWSLSVMNRSAF